MEARANFNKILEANLERAKEAAKDMPEFDAAYFAGQISGMLASRANMICAEHDNAQTSNQSA